MILSFSKHLNHLKNERKSKPLVIVFKNIYIYSLDLFQTYPNVLIIYYNIVYKYTKKTTLT